jgi:c-di-GMP-binding flagellar brake protein YcgR
MPKVGDKFKGLITGETYVVKKIESKMVLLEEQNGKSQILTELSNLKLFYGKEEKEEKTKPRYGTVNFERRGHPRFNVDLPIEYYRIDSPNIHIGRGLNISEGGLLIYFREQMDVSQYLRLRLFLSLGSELNTIEALAEVVWMDIHLGETWGDYRCGVRFIDISPEDMTKLKNFLASLS